MSILGRTVPDCAIVQGSAHPALAVGVARILDAPVVPVDFDRFPDGELGEAA